MRKRGQQGSITVFLSIILLIMITLAGVIVDAARINTAKTQVQRGLEASVNSALAGYYKPLKEQYGLFALDENNEENLKEIIEEYLSKNLMIDKEYTDENKIGNYIDLYDYEIESIEVEPIFNLTENPAIRQQILEYMKYRAPKDFIQDFMYKLDCIKKAGTTSKVCKEKIDFEKKLKKIDSIQKEIYKNIYGKYETYENWKYTKKEEKYYVVKLNKVELSNLIDKYFQVILKYQNLKEKLEELKDKIKNAESEEQAKKLKEKLKKLKKEIKQTLKEIETKYEELINGIKQYNNKNKNALENIKKLIEKSKNLSEDLVQYKNSIEENEDKIIEGSFEKFSEDIKKYESQISYSDGKGTNKELDNIMEKLKDNIECLSGKNKKKLNLLELIETIKPDKVKELEEKKLEALRAPIISKLEYYNSTIEYSYSIVEKNEEYSKFDNRKDIEEKAKDMTEITQSQEDNFGVVIEKDLYSILPSVTKLINDKLTIKNGMEFLWNTKEDEEIEGVELSKQENEGFSELAFSKLGEITDGLDLTNIRDEIYINEYTMGVFKNYVSEIDKEYNLRHLEKAEQDSYFERSEIEYILNGSKSEKINQTFMDSKILLTRFCLNSIHVFTCKEKNNTAQLTAAAVAGWYTGGAGIPIIKTLILLGWAMEESIYDLEQLKAGLEIPLYKTELEWKTSLKKSGKKLSKIDIGKEEPKDNIVLEDKEKPSSNQNNAINTSYQDYLRFFLLVQDKDETMKRVQDLIQLNLQKTTENEGLRLDGLNTYIRVEVVVSIKYLFLTQSFIPNELKTENNRHKFKVVIYQGY